MAIGRAGNRGHVDNHLANELRELKEAAVLSLSFLLICQSITCTCYYLIAHAMFVNQYS